MIPWLAVVAAASSETWTLGEEPWLLEEEAALGAAPSAWTFGSGLVFQVLDGERVVGAVVLGPGAWDVAFSSPREARAAANRLAVLEKVPREALEPVVERERWTQGTDRGWLVGLDVWDELAPHVVPIRRESGVTYGRSADGSEAVYVDGPSSLVVARLTAQELLADRSRWMREHAFDPDGLTDLDALQRAIDPGSPASLLVELRVDQALDRFAGVTDRRPPSRWLTHLSDPRGWLDPGVASRVYAQRDVDGALATRDVATIHAPRTAAGRYAPPARVDLTGAGATVTWDAEPGVSLVAVTTADLRLEAVGGPSRLVVVDVPRERQLAFYDNPPLREGFELRQVALPDGTPLAHHELDFSADPDESSFRTVAIELPEPLLPGEVVTVRLRWIDRHRYGRQFLLPIGPDQEMTVDAGASTRPVPVLPRVRGALPAAVPVDVRVGVTTALRGAGLATSGERLGQERDARYVWTTIRADTGLGAASVAVGRADESFDPAAYGLPAVRVLADPEAMHDQVPVRVRQLVHLSQSVLPPFPHPEVAYAELHGLKDGFRTVAAPAGLVTVNRAMGAPVSMPQHDLYVLATSLHVEQWLPLDPDRELAFAAAGAWGSWVVGAAHGPALERRYQARFHELARPSTGSLVLGGTAMGLGTGRGSNAGAFFVGRTLVAEIGLAGVLEAMDVLLRGGAPASWEGLRAAAENVARRDLGHVFEPFVGAAVAPTVRGEVTRTEATCRVELRTDLPFGRLNVPVRVGGVDVVVETRDGAGSAEVPRDGACGLAVDPERVLLLARLDTAGPT